MLVLTKKGLYCRAGHFYIDPSGAVENAVVTHAHSDHARRGSEKYYCTLSGLSLLRSRLGQKICAIGFDYGHEFELNGVKISFHPAGHILGSAQVRLEHRGEVWVASGDYKREPDPTCEPFEVVPCDIFVTEATFGTPAYVWPKQEDLGSQIFNWWSENAAVGKNSVLFAYSLGKAQRVLGVLKPFARKPIYCDTPVGPLTDCYRAQGISLAETLCLGQLPPKTVLRGELVLVPPSFLKTDKAKILGPRFETAFASGWMANGSHGYSKGFVMSDHADWNDLVRTVRETGAKKVFVQHRGKGALVRHLRDLGLQAFPESDLFVEESNQLELF